MLIFYFQFWKGLGFLRKSSSLIGDNGNPACRKVWSLKDKVGRRKHDEYTQGVLALKISHFYINIGVMHQSQILPPGNLRKPKNSPKFSKINKKIQIKNANFNQSSIFPEHFLSILDIFFIEFFFDFFFVIILTLSESWKE